MAIGDLITITIDSLANSGNGVGRFNNKVVFVPFSVPGDVLKIKIKQEHKTFSIGEIAEIVQASPDRVAPHCEHFGRCGGCDWQHIPYSSQLFWKKRTFEDTLRRIGKLESLPVADVVASPRQFNYRNRVQLGLEHGQFFYRQKNSNAKVFVSSCPLADQRINENWNTLLAKATKFSTSSNVELTVNPELSVHKVNESRSTSLGFRQVNDQVNELLIDAVLQIASAGEFSHIIDLYCGRGTWTIRLAESTKSKVLGIDVLPANIEWANAKKAEMNLENVTFQLGRVEELLDSLPLDASLCIVDPPRSGLDPALIAQLGFKKPKTLAYISCHPATLARDLQTLTAKSYKIIEIIPFDMFPQTAHLESLTLLQSNS